MANQLFQSYLFNDAGAAIVGATVDLLARNTTTPVLATTTTDASGLWTISHATEGRFDVRITNESSVRWHKYDTQSQIDTLEVANFRVRNPADTFDYDIVPGAITADRQLNLPVITTTDTLAVLGLAQTFSAVQTFTADPTLNDNVNLTFGTGGDVDLYYDGTNFYINPRVVGTGNVIITGTAILFMGDTANANMAIGLTINQSGNDNEILAFKSSDVAHGMSDLMETDTYAAFGKYTATGGGLLVRALADATTGDAVGMNISAAGNGDNTAKTTSAIGVLRIEAAKLGGAATTVVCGTDANLVTIDNRGTTRHIFDAEGTYHGDEVTATFDDYNDLALLDAMHDIANPFLDTEGLESRVALMEQIGVFGKGSFRFEDGKPKAFVNTTKHRQLLHSGLRLAWRESRAEIAALKARIAILEAAA